MVTGTNRPPREDPLAAIPSRCVPPHGAEMMSRSSGQSRLIRGALLKGASTEDSRV